MSKGHPTNISKINIKYLNETHQKSEGKLWNISRNPSNFCRKHIKFLQYTHQISSIHISYNFRTPIKYLQDTSQIYL